MTGYHIIKWKLQHISVLMTKLINNADAFVANKNVWLSIRSVLATKLIACSYQIIKKKVQKTLESLIITKIGI